MGRYRSDLERRVGEQLTNHEHEPFSVAYEVPKKYTPDFVPSDDYSIWYEVKGYFRTHEEAKKYVFIQENYPNITLRFIIVNPNTRAYPGVKKTMGQWLTEQGFEWCTVDNIPEEWLP